mmetsp:Transcript_7127/g.21993  ORF Transcript_7127/g.21993 Transcript_7127/m.21993 type:complete len:114 (+) Transcript_7127:2860-3201(+)
MGVAAAVTWTSLWRMAPSPPRTSEDGGGAQNLCDSGSRRGQWHGGMRLGIGQTPSRGKHGWSESLSAHSEHIAHRCISANAAARHEADTAVALRPSLALLVRLRCVASPFARS